MPSNHILPCEDLLADRARVGDIMRSLVFPQFLRHVFSTNTAYPSREELPYSFSDRGRRMVLFLRYGGAPLQRPLLDEVGVPPHVVAVVFHFTLTDVTVACRCGWGWGLYRGEGGGGDGAGGHVTMGDIDSSRIIIDDVLRQYTYQGI